MSKIITSEDLGTYMKKTLDDGQAQLVIDAVNQWIETRTGRCWGETKQVTRRFDYKRTVWLRHMDIVSIEGVQVGVGNATPQDLAEVDYYFSDLGRLTVATGFSTPLANSGRYVGVSYTYGVEEAPDDLKLAALGIAAGFYNWAVDGNKEVVSTGVGSYRLQFAGSGKDSSQGKSTSDRNFEMVDSYKARRL